MPSALRSRPWGLTLEQVLEHYGWDVDDNECWIWRGPQHHQGYATFEFQGKSVRVTRLVCELWKGLEVGALHVLHTCDVPECINPSHLFLGTQADNNADMQAKGRDRKNPLRGVDAPHHVLTEEQVRWIRHEYATSGRSQRAIATELGITQPHVSDIVRRKIWKHL